MECINCGGETGKRSKYCDNTCKTQHHRETVSGETVNETVNETVSTPKRTRTTGCQSSIPGDEDYAGCVVNGKVVTPITIPVKDLSRVQLQQAIRACPGDQWINSNEHNELMRRLHTLTVDQLEEQGYCVPAWKRAS